MKYLCLVYIEEEKLRAVKDSECKTFGDSLRHNGVLHAAEPLYPAYAAQDERLFGFSALFDQQLAGVVMMVEQTLTLGLAVLLLVRSARRARAPGAAQPV